MGDHNTAGDGTSKVPESNKTLGPEQNFRCRERLPVLFGGTYFILSKITWPSKMVVSTSAFWI
jgi:hypothetical protein